MGDRHWKDEDVFPATPSREALVAEAEKVNAERTPGPWVLSTDWCDCGNGYGCSHGEFPFALTPHPRPEGWKPYESLIDSFDKATVADGEFMAFCGTHMGTLLSLLHADAAKVQELTAEVERLANVIAHANTAMSHLIADRDRLTEFYRTDRDKVLEAWRTTKERAEKAEADVTRLMAQWEQIARHIKMAGCECANDMQCDACYLRERLEELEAQR